VVGVGMGEIVVEMMGMRTDKKIIAKINKSVIILIYLLIGESVCLH
jgi:hypothetical protein